MNIIVKFILVVLAVAIVDFFWTVYLKYAANNQPVKAGLASCMIVLLGAFTTVNYIHDHLLIGAAVIGAFLGTYVPVKFIKSK